ncbi:unnamed protein product [Effrenium voratum]|uniref:Ubiquitin-like domain-containing protein n=1 Tax=Effrenium voratum TaxID=2562239 RepID=A0AA36INI9_9DINO|nr:unnamed protein product [Effrenium voratum]
MGQNPNIVPPVSIPIPTKTGSRKGGEFTQSHQHEANIYAKCGFTTWLWLQKPGTQPKKTDFPHRTVPNSHPQPDGFDHPPGDKAKTGCLDARGLGAIDPWRTALVAMATPKQKLIDLKSEQDWLDAKGDSPIKINVDVSVVESELGMSNVTVELPLTETCAAVKAKLVAMGVRSIPANRMKLHTEPVGFLKERFTFAFYNLQNGVTLVLSQRKRAGSRFRRDHTVMPKRPKPPPAEKKPEPQPAPGKAAAALPDLPKLPNLPSMPGMTAPGMATAKMPGMPGMPGMPMSMPGGMPGMGIPGMPSLPNLPGLTVPGAMPGKAQGMPMGGPTGPGMPGGYPKMGMPQMPGMPMGMPGMGMPGMGPGGPGGMPMGCGAAAKGMPMGPGGAMPKAPM